MNIPGRKIFNGEKVFTDWVARRGDNVILRADRVASSGTTTATIKVYTKNSEDVGDGEPVEDSGGDLSFTVTNASTAVEELVVDSAATTAAPKGLLEMVRLGIEVTGTDASDYVQVRLFPPVCFNAAS